MSKLSRWLFGDLHDSITELSAQLALTKEEIAMSLDKLREEIAQNREVTASAVALLRGLKEKLDAAIDSGDMGEVEKLAQELDASNNELAAAVTANTPSEGGADAGEGAGGADGDTGGTPADGGQPGNPGEDPAGSGASVARGAGYRRG